MFFTAPVSTGASLFKKQDILQRIRLVTRIVKLKQATIFNAIKYLTCLGGSEPCFHRALFFCQIKNPSLTTGKYKMRS